MNSTRSTRSSVLGKRGHQQEGSVSTPPVITPCDQLQTPDPTPNPKRPRTSIGLVDGDSNKENVPPFVPELINIDAPSPRGARALRRTTTELTTPARLRTAIRRTASTSTLASSPGTPTTEISHLAIATPPPTPPTSLLPLHARARALLRSTCNNISTEIAGRDNERATIHNFLFSFLDSSAIETDDEPSTSLYISGSPGTGKTALVNAIMRSLPAEAKVVSINCMALSSIEALWDRLVEELEDGKKRKTAGRVKKIKGRDAVEKLFANYHSKCVVILDELDHIAPTSQSLTTIFSLPNATSSTLRLIGIANTHTLTSSSSSTSSISAASKVCTLHFAPYTPAQLLQILQSRLKSLTDSENDDDKKQAADVKKFLPSPTLMLLTKKVAALTGDVRSLFEVLRGAIDLAVVASVSSPPSPTPAPTSTVDDNSLDTPAPIVTPGHILAALKAYTPSSTSTSITKSTNITPLPTTNSEIVAKVSNLGLQARLVILCALLASKRLEVGLPISSAASILASPTKKIPISPMKRSSSLPNPSANVSGVGIDANQLHTYYSTVLNRSDGGVLEPVSRGEFGDLIGVLEGVGLVRLGGTADTLAGTGARRAFGRSASFGGGAGFGGAGKGKGKGDIKLAGGVRADEVLRGLGISAVATASSAVEGDARQEEVKAIWEREKARLGRDLKAIEREKGKALTRVDGFEGASED
ncbi:P-loop containing nucleoside triphosphate hydrolase protein [Collybia nuda]|uniref:P-loop containing nucleoside triphosphate hydrolase protein n=1 Tax=Collybia nuda TaxID=64659 RepID=A0A9P6CIX7_9AGAR|nr:P-loop containing nucleoside triphosphate hydrolase protein [Collybia nuda]